MRLVRNIALLILVSVFLVNCSDNHSQNRQGYVEGEMIYVASPFSGVLKDLLVQRGNEVKKDQLLFTLDPEPELSQLQAAEAKYKEAKATLANLQKGQRLTILESLKAKISQTKAALQLAKERLARSKKLFKRGAIDEDSFDAASAEFKKQTAVLEQEYADLAEAELGSRTDLIEAQKASVDTLAAELTKARWASKQKTLHAPTTGTIYDTLFKSGEFVPANNSVLSLLAPENIRIIFFVPEPMLSQIALNETITFNCDNCKKTFEAKITYVSPEAEYTPPVIYSEKNNEKLVYRVKARPTDKTYKLHPGQPVYVHLSKPANNKS